jgi:hypothetical protein
MDVKGQARGTAVRYDDLEEVVQRSIPPVRVQVPGAASFRGRRIRERRTLKAARMVLVAISPGS